MNDELINGDGAEVKSPNNKKKYIIIFLISFILIAGLVVLLFFLLRGKDKNDEDDEDGEKEEEICLVFDDQTNECLKCNSKFYLVEGICKSYSFMAIYSNENQEEEIQLINDAFRAYIGGMYMNNSNIDIKTSYTFSSIGNHTIYFYLNISSMDSLQSMFYKVEKMISINFSPEFNTKNIKSMNNMFSSCISLKS